MALAGVEGASPEELRALVGAVCRVLELAGPAQVLPAVEAMRAAMEAIPPLEAFVKDVCAFLARETLPGGAHLSPEEALGRMDLPGAQRALRAWAKEVKAAARLRRFQSRLRTVVSTRIEAAADAEDAGVLVLDDDQLLATVQGLVALEHQALRTQGAREAAEAYLAGRPELLVNRAVQHFRYLFQVKALEGVLPKMNELYLFSAEMAALTRALRSALGLSPTVPTNKLLAELQALIRRARQAARSAKGRVVEDGEKGEEEDEEDVVVDEGSLLMTDLNLSTVVEEDGEESQGSGAADDEEEEGEEEEPVSSSYSSSSGGGVGEEEEERDDDGAIPPTPAGAPSISLSSSPAMDSEAGRGLGLRRVPGPKSSVKGGSSSSWGVSPAATSRSQHPMLAVLSAAESQESPFLPQQQRQRGQQQQGGAGVPESPALFVASSKLGTAANEPEQRRGSAVGLDDSANSSGRYPTTYGRSSSGYGAGSSGSGSLSGLLGVLSAAESGGTLPSPAPGRDVSLSLSSDGGVQ